MTGNGSVGSTCLNFAAWICALYLSLCDVVYTSLVAAVTCYAMVFSEFRLCLLIVAFWVALTCLSLGNTISPPKNCIARCSVPR